MAFLHFKAQWHLFALQFKMFFYLPQEFQPSWVLPCFFVQLPVPIDEQQAHDDDMKIQCKKENQSAQVFQKQNGEKKFQSLLQEFLMKKRSKVTRKRWRQEQDDLLLELREKNFDWEEISKSIQSTNSKVCERRFQRLFKQRRKWTHQDDQFICTMHEVEKKSWKEIAALLSVTKARQISVLPKQVKFRYKEKLRGGISEEPWRVQEDIQILKLIQKVGKKWSELSKIMTQRTDLQLKNRYHKVLKKAIESVKRKYKKLKKSNK